MTAWLRNGCLALVALLMVSATAAAQQPDGTMVYSRIANWQIARTAWDAYDADVKKNQVPVMDKLVADGVITEYGFARNTVHTPDGYTHVTWFCSKTIAGLETALAAIIAAEAKLPAAAQRRANTDFAGTKHSDVMARTRVIKGKTAKLDGGYLYGSMDVVQPGKGGAYTERMDKQIRPALESLFSSGSLTSFGVDTEFVHTTNPGLRTLWILVPTAEALDKLAEAQQSLGRSMTPAERDAAAQSWRETIDSSAHRDELWQMVAYSAKY